MSTPRDPDITEAMLHAFVDGQLSASDMQRVETYLNAHPEAAAEVVDWADQNDTLNALFPAPDALPDLPNFPEATAPTILTPLTPEAAADTLTPRPVPAPPAPHSAPAPHAAPAPISAPLRASNDNAAPRGLSWSAIAASLVMLGLGLGGGWFARGIAPVDPQLMARLVTQAVNAHAVYSVDPHRAVEIAASEEETLVRWLSNRVGEPLTAPDLTDQGFDLVGGRLLAVTEGPAAQFLYENAEGTRITLFASRAATGQLASFNYNQSGDTGSFYWEDENLSYAIVGDVDRPALNRIAMRVYEQF